LLFDPATHPFPQRLLASELNPVISSRRYLFAFFGLVLPLAAFTASPAAAATSNALDHKSHSHHASATHKGKSHHGGVHTASHPPSHHPSHKVTAS
jgi:hypothetical protein